MGKVAKLEALLNAIRWMIREARAGRAIQPGSHPMNALILAFREFGGKEV